MTRPNVEDFLKQGIYGPKEINPDEKRKFLGTFRERVVLALTQGQVRESEIYKEVEDALKINPTAKLLLNGNIDYSYLSKYTKLCNKYRIEFTVVTNKDYNSELGLVLAHDYAVDKENIFIKHKKVIFDEKKNSKEKGFFSLFSRAFKKK